MYTMNQITIIGFTGSDAETHYTKSGSLVLTLSVATKGSWKDADGNWQNRTDWHRIVSFGKQAELTRMLDKHSYVMVQAPCAVATMSAMARSTASSQCAPTRLASSIAQSVALNESGALPESSSLMRRVPDPCRAITARLSGKSRYCK